MDILKAGEKLYLCNSVH
ncbi:hypothetical protein JL09_g6712 [Pichia kudriavzevii]|uniref:Uncharacterized protein n=1 Tax=Pichia kudriavzevii TaxID=4909 RepID=A0A099NL49_PICKU|nr:hypothetical protein JL09_g6712 [Pichia kudriavzevii]